MNSYTTFTLTAEKYFVILCTLSRTSPPPFFFTLLTFTLPLLLKWNDHGAKAMAQELGTRTDLAEDQGSVLSTHVVASNHP